MVEQSTNAITAEEFREIVAAIETQVGQVIVGQAELVRHTLVTLLAGGGNALLEGVPGYWERQCWSVHSPQAVDCSFSRIQFTPDLMPADIVGTNLIVEDEQGRPSSSSNRDQFSPNSFWQMKSTDLPPKTQSAMLEAMRNIRSRSPSKPAACQSLFLSLLPRNPLGNGRHYPLPEASSTASSSRSMFPFPSVADLGRDR